MQSVYLAVLIVSTVLAAAGFLRAHRQIAPVFNINPQSVGLLMILPVLGFLVIIAAPGPVIMGGLLMAGIGLWDDIRGMNPSMGLALTLLATSMGLMGLPGWAVPHVPMPLVMLAVWLAWWGMGFAAGRLPLNLIQCLFTAALVLLPLPLASWFGIAPKNLALEVAIIYSAFLGALFVVGVTHTAALALRLPLTFLMGYGIWLAAASGGWVFALASGVLLCAVILRGPHRSQPPRGPRGPEAPKAGTVRQAGGATVQTFR